MSIGFEGQAVEPVPLNEKFSFHLDVDSGSASTITHASVGSGSWKWLTLQVHPDNAGDHVWLGSQFTVTEDTGTLMKDATLLAWDLAAAPLFAIAPSGIDNEKLICTVWR